MKPTRYLIELILEGELKRHFPSAEIVDDEDGFTVVSIPCKLGVRVDAIDCVNRSVILSPILRDTSTDNPIFVADASETLELAEEQTLTVDNWTVMGELRVEAKRYY